MALTSTGDVLIADPENNTIRNLSPDGLLTTFSGGDPTGTDATSFEARYLDAPGPTARFNTPLAIAVDAAGSAYVADARKHLVRKIDASGNVTTLPVRWECAEMQTALARPPHRVAPQVLPWIRTATCMSEWAPSTQWLPRQPTGNPIRKITAAGVVSTVAFKVSEYLSPTIGYLNPRVYYPVQLSTDNTGPLYAADRNDHVVRKFSRDGQVMVRPGTVAQNNAGYVDGPASAARFGELQAITIDRTNRVFVLHNYAGTPIREIAANGAVTTVRRAPNCEWGSDGLRPALCAAKSLVVDATYRFLVT